jgi:hypothetical protein
MSKYIKIKITEKQFILLKEQAQLSLFKDSDVEKDVLQLLCKKSSDINSSFCRLEKERINYPEDLKKSLNKSIEILYKFFYFKNVGAFPAILEIALERKTDVVNFLNIISDFINDDKFNNTVTKKQLKSFINNPNQKLDDLDGILRNIVKNKSTKYEESYVGDTFELNRSFIDLGARCVNLFGIIRNILQNPKSEEKELETIKKCISEKLKTDVPSKHDVRSKTSLSYETEYGEEIVLNPSTGFEIKMTDINSDHIFSEFFSLFKNKKKKHLSTEFIQTYDRIVKKIFDWLINNSEAKKYLERLSSNMNGIFYNNYIFVPIKYIEFYWSDVGQRKTERRLSIRFRIKNKYIGEKITVYKFVKGSNKMDKMDVVITKNFAEPQFYHLNQG